MAAHDSFDFAQMIALGTAPDPSREWKALRNQSLGYVEIIP
jgi:hypothetical protein